jgi:hypothetical protein
MRRATVFLQEEWETLEKRVHKIEEVKLERAEISTPLEESIKRFRSRHGILTSDQLYSELKTLDEFFAENAEGTSLDLILVYSSFVVTRLQFYLAFANKLELSSIKLRKQSSTYGTV